MKVIFLMFLIIGMSSCASSSRVLDGATVADVKGQNLEQWNHLIGRWHGSNPIINGGTHSWLIDRFANGTYLIKFKSIHADGSIREGFEAGDWGSSGDIYFQIYRKYFKGEETISSNPSSPENYDAYYIIKLDESELEFKHARTSYTFIENKVGNDFKL